jgi:Fe2+ or Zn2+ uptake regulation protein
MRVKEKPFARFIGRISMTSNHRHFYNNPNELQRMLLHGWIFCEECGRKVHVEDLVEYYCAECAERKQKQNRTKIHLEQKCLLTFAAQEYYAPPEGSASKEK